MIKMSQPLIDALKLFGDAAKMMIIATALILVSISIVLSIPFTTISALLRFYDDIRDALIGYFILIAILTLSSLILIFVSIYGMLIGSARHFANYKSELSIVKNHIQWGFIGGLILAILGALLYLLGFIANPLATSVGLPLLIIGMFMLWLGGIGLSVLCFKLYEEFKSISILMSGIFFIVMGALSLISWILIHIETRSLIAKITGAGGTAVIMPPPPP
ncbi:MAG: hypothetical protein QW332_06475 [Thermoproteota archaeon]